MSAAGPVAPAERIDSIDILRGLALLGVLVINTVFDTGLACSAGWA